MAARQCVVILGAGINGCALARELALNDVPVWLIDCHDIAAGASAGSSHLIHGGLRYLEYGEFGLVKESLAERARLLRLAPQFVRPLRLWIPTSNRFGGAMGAIGRFFNWSWWPSAVPANGRGIELVRAGLTLYDLYARDASVPKHRVTRLGDSEAPSFNREKYNRLAAYYDGQVEFPERLTLALLADAQEISHQRGLDFQVFTHHTATLTNRTVTVRQTATGQAEHAIEPAAIVNATGAWVDETLAALDVRSKRLMGGTKGSHLFTFSPRLREVLSEQGVYAEARDGRPIFITPLADTVLIGTTDIRFAGPPEDATTTESEIEYLLGAVNTILPDARLSREDIAFHYSAVRPLPFVDARSTASITRRHALVWHEQAEVPLVSVVGGKLTTMRSLAESGAAAVLQRLNREVIGTSSQRVIPGGEDYPADGSARTQTQQRIATELGFEFESVRLVWRLVGTRCREILAADDDRGVLADTALPCSLARWSLAREHGPTLADLVERRLMLLYHQRLSRACLRQLAEMLQAGGMLSREAIDAAVEQQMQRLASRYGKQVV